MTPTRHVRCLTTGVARAPERLMAPLLAAAGRWPVLLALVNGAIHTDIERGRDAAESMCEILDELHSTGPTVLDITDDDQRHTAVARTLGVSLNRLAPAQRERYQELAVFAEDVAIPVEVLKRYWMHTSGLSAFQTRRLCQRLADLSLVTYRGDPDRVQLHDVTRAYLLGTVRHRLPTMHQTFVDAHRDLVPVRIEGGSDWPRLASEHRYLWEWLPSHLGAAGNTTELHRCLHDQLWLLGKLQHFGPAALESDLTSPTTPSAGRWPPLSARTRTSRSLGTARVAAATFASRIPPGSPPPA